MRRGEEWYIREDWGPYFQWLESRIYHPGRWAVIPDAPGAPSQLNDALLNDWPFGQKGSPLWHFSKDEVNIARLGRLCEKFGRVCVGWVGHPKKEPVGCPDYRRGMEQVSRLFGNQWHPIHMLRGVAVAFDYPFLSADSTSLAQNGHRYDWLDAQGDMFLQESKWKGRHLYADRLERRTRQPSHHPRSAS